MERLTETYSSNIGYEYMHINRCVQAVPMAAVPVCVWQTLMRLHYCPPRHTQP